MENNLKEQLLKISQMAGNLCEQAQEQRSEIYDVSRYIQLVIYNYLDEDGSMVFKRQKGGKYGTSEKSYLFL